MNTRHERAALTCKLTTPEILQRKKTVVVDLKKALLEKVESPHGFSYRFEATDHMLDKLNDFIQTERLCCNFFVFTLTVSGEANDVWLALSGPEGVKEFIADELGL